MPVFRADLHLHSCLSPCGDLDMSPRELTRAAAAKGLDIVALCDHNTMENVPAAIRAAMADGGRVTVLAGMEICTAEEVHLVALFGEPGDAEKVQALVYAGLPPGVNRPEVFGEQVVANEFDEVEGFNDRLLISATNLDLAAVVAAVHEHRGLAVAAHVDRPAFGLLGQLGFVPPGLELDALEVSPLTTPAEQVARRPELAAWPILRSSDAHHPRDVGTAWTEFEMERPTLSELRLALKGAEGRRILRTDADPAIG